MAPLRRPLRDDALAIWRAGLAAVAPERLVADALGRDGSWLAFGDERLDLARVRRLVVVGAGKAGAGMAAAVERVIGDEWAARLSLSGWVNVPADCLQPLHYIHLHAGRPAGANEPRPEGVVGAEAILAQVAGLGRDDVCLALFSGGGSALLPAPVAGVTLADKLAVTRLLGAAGATITELNTVRTHLSRIKGGGLVRACRAGRLVSLVISDVPGDRLEIIASGPTVPTIPRPAEALAILTRLVPRDEPSAPSVWQHLRHQAALPRRAEMLACPTTNLIIGNNATAVDAAGAEAERRGYSHAMVSAAAPEGEANDLGRHLARLARRMRDEPGPDALISGGEPTVTLAPPETRGQGGRNQQLVLAALAELTANGAPEPCRGLCLVSGGTDGEDGPTDAAGAVLDAEVATRARQLGLDLAAALTRNDAYPFFQAAGGLLQTGPTHTNVGDLRVVLVDRQSVTAATPRTAPSP